MSLYTEEEIKKEIQDNWEWIKEQKYPEDLAHEYADSACPVYYHDIYLTWRDLPEEHSNQFKESISELPDRIEDLMLADIYLYYFLMYSGAIVELLEKEGMR